MTRLPFSSIMPIVVTPPRHSQRALWTKSASPTSQISVSEIFIYLIFINETFFIKIIRDLTITFSLLHKVVFKIVKL